MFLTSKCRAESNSSLCTTSGLSKKKPLQIRDFQLTTCLAAKFVGICQCTMAFLLQVPKLCTNQDLTLLYSWILVTHSKFAQEKHLIALWHFLPADMFEPRGLFARLPLQDHVYICTDESFRFHNNEFDEMPCKLVSTEYPRSFEKYSPPP